MCPRTRSSPSVAGGRGSSISRTTPGTRSAHTIVRAFGDIAGVPVLLNTSFNVMGKPIVETLSHAPACMAKTGI
jgi:carbamoyltransferase